MKNLIITMALILLMIMGLAHDVESFHIMRQHHQQRIQYSVNS